MAESVLFRLLRKRLSPEMLETLRGTGVPRDAESYRAVLQRVRRDLPRLRQKVAHSERRIEEMLEGVVEIPPDRLSMLVENGPPALLTALSRFCMQRSFGERFDNPKRSLELADVALRAARAVADSGLLDQASQSDLEAEAWMYVANARRITSDLPGAEEAFATAEKTLGRGTGERDLSAKLLQLKASLKFSQGLAEEAAELFDREIRLRRTMDEPELLGKALINRGIIAAWSEALEKACDFLSEGATLTDDPDYLLLTLTPIAERLARDGQGLAAWRVVRQIEAAVAMGAGESHVLRLRWVKAITYRALGDLDSAARSLEIVRDELIEKDLAFRASLASLDLAAVYAAQGRTAEVIVLAEGAYRIFQAERLERRALAAVLLLRRAAESQTLTESLAVRVANFLGRSRYDRKARFGPLAES